MAERLNPLNVLSGGGGGVFTLGPGGVPYGKELKDSWATLKTRVQKGDFNGIHIGDYKTVKLTGGAVVIAEVAGIDTYYKFADQQIGHHIDFISRDCLKGAKTWNAGANNNGTKEKKNPWLASRLCGELNGAIFGTLPADLQAAIIEKRALIEERYGAAGNLTADSGWSWQNIGKLWLPTEVEVFGASHWSEPGFGTGGGGCNIQYPIFIGGSKHIIKGDGNGGARTHWWELSVRHGSATSVCAVDYYGAAFGYSAADTDIRAPICFRIG